MLTGDLPRRHRYFVNPLTRNRKLGEEKGRERFAEEKTEFPSQVVSKSYVLLFSAKFEPVFEPVQGPCTMSVQNEPLPDMACVVKRETTPK